MALNLRRRRVRRKWAWRDRRGARAGLWAAAIVLAVAVVVGLVFLLDHPSTGNDLPAAGPSPSSAGSSAGASRSGSRSPSPSDSASLPALPGFGNATGVNSTNLSTLGPGEHQLRVVVTSDEPMLAVAYSIKGDTRGRTAYNVKSPFTVERTLTGQRPYAAVAFQMGPTAHRGSCRISIDGKTVNTQSATAAYSVIGCTG